MCVFVHVHAHAKAHMCARGHRVGPRNQTQVFGVGSNLFYPPGPSPLPSMHCFQFLIYWGKQGLKEFLPSRSSYSLVPGSEALPSSPGSEAYVPSCHTITSTTVSYFKYGCTSGLSEKYSKYLAFLFISWIQWKRPLTHKTVNEDCRLLEIPYYSVCQVCHGSQASCRNVICQHRTSFPW